MVTRAICVDIVDDVRIEAIHNLSKKGEWSVLYWTPSGAVTNQIRKLFQDTIVHDYYDAMRGIPPEAPDFKVSQNSEELVPDADILNRMSKYEHIILAMMDRADPEHRMGYKERVTYYWRLLSYWRATINELKPDVILFSTIPHSIYDYIIYCLAQINNIQTICFVYTAFPNLFLPLASFDKRTSTEDRYNQLLTNETTGEVLLAEEIQRVVDGMVAPSPEVPLAPNLKPVRKQFLINNERYYIGISRYRFALSGIYRLLLHKIFHGNKKKKSYMNISANQLYDSSEISLYDFEKYKIKSRSTKGVLYRDYKSRCCQVDFKRPYVYFALGYQPECQSSPLAGYFYNQLWIAKILSLSLPSGWIVYVKENPVQLSPRLYGEASRAPDYYAQLDKIDNIRLVPTTTSTIDLIDCSQCTATATGTVGLESVLRGKPVLTFGNSWYRGCEGVFSVTSVGECHKALNEISAEYVVNEHRVRLFLLALEETSISVFLNDSYGEPPSVSEKTMMVSQLENLLLAFSEKGFLESIPNPQEKRSFSYS